MRRSVPAGLTLVGAGIVLAFSPVGGKVAQAVLPGPDSKPGAPDMTVSARVPPSAADPTPAQPTVPTAAPEPALTAAQQATAFDAVAHDASLAALSGGESYRIVDTVPWTEPGSSDVVGADLTLEYAAPVEGAVTLPGARFDAAGKTYKQLKYNVKVKQLTRVHVVVDLRGVSKVVDVALEDGVAEELPGNTHFKARDGEGGE